MNNYLSNLVGKTLNRIPLARPHRAPLFAPTPYTSGALGTPETNAFPARFTHEEHDATPDAQQNESSQVNLRHARTAPSEDERGADAHSLRRRADASEALRESHADESQENFFAEPRPALLAPPPKQTRHTPAQIQSTIPSTPREEHDETASTERRVSSSTHDSSEAAQSRVRTETLRPKANADAHDAAARETSAALSRLRERLNRDERETLQLEGELADTRADVRRLDADASQRNRPQVRTTLASESDKRAERAREELREEAAARQAKPVAPPGVSRAPQLKFASAASSPRRSGVEEVKSNAPAPTIQVTIGRIEVRANAAQSSTPSRAQGRAATPQLSLEEYLRQRNGGER